VRVELFDGKYHPVDSKDIAFQIAGRQAFKEAALQARPILLEPIMIMEVTVPEDKAGDIMGHLNSRRGRVLGMEPSGKRKQMIRAEVPLAEVQRYAPDLQSITGGRGSYTLQFLRYEQVPAHLQEKIVAESKGTVVED
jgi:elongation factor G